METVPRTIVTEYELINYKFNKKRNKFDKIITKYETVHEFKEVRNGRQFKSKVF